MRRADAGGRVGGPSITAVGLACALATWGCGGDSPGAPGDAGARASVLLVTLDTTRADRLGCYGRADAGTPHLDALAARGARFDRVYATAPITLPSHASLLTASTPPYHGLRDNGLFVLDERIDTIAETFRDSGMRTAAFISAFPLFAMFGLNQGFELYDDRFVATDPAMAGQLGERPAMDTVQAATRWLSELEADEPFFAWVHLFDPHAPLQAPEPFAGRFPDDPYQAEIAYADAAVGELLGTLERLGRRARTLVAVTADHGEGLGEHGEEGHAILLYDGTLRVPLILAGPGVEPAVVAAPASLIDVAATLVELAGVDDGGVYSRHGGASLVPELRGAGADAPRDLYFETYFPRLHHGWSELVGLARGEWKYVEAPGAVDERGVARAELVRPTGDPAERVDLAAREAVVARELARRLAALRERLASSGVAALRRDVQSEDLERLAALGYGGLDVLATELDADAEVARARDPREVVEAVSYLNAVRALAHSGEFPRAEVALERLAAIDPGGVPEHEATGDLSLARGRSRLARGDAGGTEDLERAATAFRFATELKPGRRGLWVRRAEALELLGRLEETLSCLDRAMALAPPNQSLLETRAKIVDRLEPGTD